MAAGPGVAAALDDLERVAVLWRFGGSRFAPVVHAACEVLVAGGEGQALAELAGASPDEPPRAGDAEDQVVAALGEQGRQLPESWTPEAATAAVRAMTAEALAGRVSPRALCAWTHLHIGHTGVDMAQPLVELDDVYDDRECSDAPVTDLDAEVLDHCRAVLGDAR